MTTPFKDCPACGGNGWQQKVRGGFRSNYSGVPAGSFYGPPTGEYERNECDERPCPTCAAHEADKAAAVEREVAAAVGSKLAEVKAYHDDVNDAQSRRAAKLEAEVARLTAQGKELRDALQFVAGSGNMAYAKKLQEDDHVCDLDHKDEIDYGECIERAITTLAATPAGSDEPLRRVRADIYREVAKECREWAAKRRQYEPRSQAAIGFDNMAEWLETSVDGVIRRGGEGGSR